MDRPWLKQLLTRPALAVGAVLVAVMPWLSGGRDATWMLVSAFALLAGALVMVRGGSQRAVASRPLQLSLALWLGWGALGLTWSVNRYQSEVWLLMMLLAVGAGALVAGLDEARKRWVVNGYLGIALIAALIGYYLYFTGSYGRLTSTFYWANPAAAYLLPAVLITGWRWIAGQATIPGRSWIDAAAAAVLTSAFWLTDSRGGILVLLLLTGAALARSGKIRRNLGQLLLIAALSFGVAALSAAVKTNVLHSTAVAPGSRFSEAAQGESTSIGDRWRYWESAGAIWWDHPLAGTGPATYASVHPQYQQRVISASTDAHNVYLQALAEQGIVGAILLAWVLIWLLLGLIRGESRPDLPRGLLALAAVGLLLHFGIDIDARYPALVVLLAVLFGVSYRPAPKTEHGLNKGAVPALLLAAAVLAASNYLSYSWQRRGNVYNLNRNYTKAAEAYARAHTGLMYDPNNWTAEGIDYYALATTTGSRQYLDSAVGLAHEAIARDPKDAQHYFLLGRIERLLGKLPAAESDFRLALTHDPYNHPEYYADLASLQLQRGDLAGMRQTAGRGAALYPDDVIKNRSADLTIKPSVARLLVLKAYGQMQQGHNQAALVTLKRALLLDPNNQDARNLQRQSATTGG